MWQRQGILDALLEQVVLVSKQLVLLAPLEFLFFKPNFLSHLRKAFHIDVSCDFFSEPNLNVQRDGDAEQTTYVFVVAVEPLIKL